MSIWGIYILLTQSTDINRYIRPGKWVVCVPWVNSILTQSTRHPDIVTLGKGIVYVHGIYITLTLINDALTDIVHNMCTCCIHNTDIKYKNTLTDK